MRRGIDFACGVWSRQQEKAWRMRRREPHSRKWRTMSVSGKEGGEKVALFDSQDSPQIFEITAPKPYESGSKSWLAWVWGSLAAQFRRFLRTQFPSQDLTGLTLRNV